jgi:hypothetical protein
MIQHAPSSVPRRKLKTARLVRGFPPAVGEVFLPPRRMSVVRGRARGRVKISPDKEGASSNV